MVNYSNSTTQKTPQAGSVTVMQAIAQSSTLGSLLARMDNAQSALATVREVLPLSLQNTVRSGPVSDGAWTLLVTTSSSLAKLKQLTPRMLARLQENQLAIEKINLKRIFE